MSRALPPSPPKYQGSLTEDEITALRLLLHHASHPDRKAFSKRDSRFYLSSTENKSLYEFHRRKNRFDFHRVNPGGNTEQEAIYNQIYRYYSHAPSEINDATWPLLKLAYRLDAAKTPVSAPANESHFWSPGEADRMAIRQVGEHFSGLFWSFRYIEGNNTPENLFNCTLIEVTPGKEAGQPPRFRAWFRSYNDATPDPLSIAEGQLYPLAGQLFWAGHLTYGNFAPYIHVTRFHRGPLPMTVFSSLLFHRGTLQRYMAARTRFLRVERSAFSDWVTQKDGMWWEKQRGVGAMTESAFCACNLADHFGTSDLASEEVLKTIGNETPGDGKRPLTRHP